MSDLGRRRALLPAFTPSAVPAEQLAARTVGRDDVIARIRDRLRTAASSGDRAHVLVVGPRGSGKTHLLHVVIHETMRDVVLRERLAVVTLPEDAPEIVSYGDLLYAVVERLLGPGVADADATLRAARAARRDLTELERLVAQTLGERVLVLVVENLDRLFTDFGSIGQSRLRAFAETSQQVVLLASTPLLFAGVSDHAQPWYGAFHVEHLAGLTAEEGGQLLRHMAVAVGDPALEAFLETPSAESRLRAVTHLTGGSPRMWTVLAGCLTVELLDELVPLIRALLDELVPYYQERLGSLSPVERKLVVELCRTSAIDETGRVVSRAHGMRTVKDLAQQCGLDRAVVATTLGRLFELRWVSRTKPEGTDKRTTWYEIREPMLRHHLQYRDDRGETLRVIVTFLREWYSPVERQRRFAEAEAGSLTESYLHDVVIGGQPPASDNPYSNADLTELLAGARCWREERRVAGGQQVRSSLAALAAEVVAQTLLNGGAVAVRTARRRIESAPPEEAELLSDVAAAAIDAVGDPVAAAAFRDGGDPPAETSSAGYAPRSDEARARAGTGLSAALAVAESRARERDVVALGLLRAGWLGACGDDAGALAGLERIAPLAQGLDDHPLRLAVDGERAFFSAENGDLDRALDIGTATLREREERFGRTHADTLTSRINVASWIGERGEHERARELFAELVVDCQQSWGPDDPGTLSTRGGFAYEVNECGDPEQAAALLTALVADRERVFGLDDDLTLALRGGLAHVVGEAGDHERARRLFEDLITDRARMLGPGHPATLLARHWHACELNACGDHEKARAQLVALVADAERVLGADDRRTLLMRHNHAVVAAWCGDFARSSELLAAVSDDRERVLGRDDADAVRSAAALADALLGSGKPIEALVVAAGALARSRDTGGETLSLELTATLARAARAQPLDVLMQAADDSPLGRARDAALEAGPDAVLSAWMHLALDAVAGDPRADHVATARWLVDQATQIEKLFALDVALVVTIRVLAQQPPAVRATWLAMWGAALGGIDQTTMAMVVLPALDAHLDGDGTALLGLSADVRELVLGLLELAEGSAAGAEQLT